MGIRIRGRLIELRPVNAGDAELLVEWHADPEVSRYWDDHVYTLQEMRERLARPDVDRYVIKAEGVLVGFIRAWREGGGVGLDMFLVPGARGRGLGLDATRSLVGHLVAEGWSRITVD